MALPTNDSFPESNFHTNASAEVIYDNLTNKYVFDLGPKRDSLSSVIPITAIYVTIFISGLVGNVCTCFVIIRNRHMRTATNYYLFSLAVSDLLLLIFGLPQELYQLWFRYPYVFGEAFCILRGFTSEMSTNASILTITCFTMERYLAICHPIRAKTMSKLSRAVKITMFVWVAGALCAIPMAIQFGVVVKQYEGKLVLDTAECTVKNLLQDAFASSTFCFFIIPMVVISVLYGLIGMQLRASELQANAEYERQKLDGSVKDIAASKVRLVNLLTRQSTRSIRGTGINSRKAVIKMLFAVVVAFFLCWAPFHGQRLMAIYVQSHTPTVIIIYTTLTYISGVTYYVSATINPILYSIMSKKFRQAFKDTFLPCCKRRDYNRGSSRYNSYMNYTRSTQSSISNSSFHKKNSNGQCE